MRSFRAIPAPGRPGGRRLPGQISRYRVVAAGLLALL